LTVFIFSIKSPKMIPIMLKELCLESFSDMIDYYNENGNFISFSFELPIADLPYIDENDFREFTDFFIGSFEGLELLSFNYDENYSTFRFKFEEIEFYCMCISDFEDNIRFSFHVN